MEIRRIGSPLAASLAIFAGEAEAQQPPSVAPRVMQQVAPDLAGYTDNILFGDIWRRPGLTPRDRSLVTVAVLVATGKTAQLEGHLARALDNGVKPSEIAGLITHLAFYSGWPSAVSALEVVDRVYRARGIDPATARPTTGALLRAVPGEAARADTVQRQVAPTAPKLAELTDDLLFGDLWRRPDLAPRDRSLVTIAALAAMGTSDPLAFHLRLGMENGLRRDELAEAFTHLAFYAGWMRAMAAVATLAATQQATPAGEPLTIVPPGTAPSAGPASNFTGAVQVSSPFKGTGDARIGGATVTFQPGAHSNWHSHPLGQLLIVTGGRGWVQAEGEPVRAIGPGDVIWTAPGVKHWHGATRTAPLTHVAVAEALGGRSVDWLGPVSDAEYRGPR